MTATRLAAALPALLAACSGSSSTVDDIDAGQLDAAPPPTVPELVDHGQPGVVEAPRPAFGGLVAAIDGARTYVVESRRDVEAGPFGLPWRSRFRLAAYDGETLAWAFAAPPDDTVGDVVVHPSGELTVAVEHFAPARDAFELVRLARGGEVVARTTLAHPLTIPAGDLAAEDPSPLFLMKSELADATTAGWVRLLADGEDLVVALLSIIDAPQGGSRELALGLETLDGRAGAYVERWARVVEGRHFAEPAAWAYDELRWRQQAIRPFLARDDASGDLLVGRAWNQSRCRANLRAFAEFPAAECLSGAAGNAENELLPLAVTRFDAAGARRGTRILRPDADAAEQLPFALAARGGELAVVGSVVRQLPDGRKRTYPDPDGFVDYDGYVQIFDAEGAPLRGHDFNLGRGDALVAMRWTDAGIVAVGASGWDRWQGGMSIGRGADPLFVWLSRDGADARQRIVELGDTSRHWNLHDVVLREGAVIAVGFSDAPMTHSADGGNTAARTFGPLRLTLAP